MADVPPAPGAPTTFNQALRLVGHPPDARPSPVVIRRRAGILVTLGTVDTEFKVHPVGFFFNSEQGTTAVVDPHGPVRPPPGPSEAHAMSGPGALVIDALVELARNFLSRVETVDSEVGKLEEDPLNAPLEVVVRLKRRAGLLRSEVGRALTALAELQEPWVDPHLPGFPAALAPVETEFLRIRDLVGQTQTALTDLIVLRQADTGNRLAALANHLNEVNNRIAELANISNVRMLGLSYITLILAIAAAINIFPNTAATILGMPTAGWVPGIVVVLVLVITTAVPLYWVLTQRWVRTIFRSMKDYETKVQEGIRDIPELVAGEQVPVARAAPPTSRAPPP